MEEIDDNEFYPCSECNTKMDKEEWEINEGICNYCLMFSEEFNSMDEEDFI